MQPQTVIFFGPSGAGKGTQARLLTEYFRKNDQNRDTFYFGTGESVRKFVQENDNYSSARIREIVNSGRLFPSFIPIWLWSDFLIKRYTESAHLVLDGMRRLLEVTVLDGTLSFYNRKDTQVIVLNVSRDWSLKRMKERGRSDDMNEKEVDNRLSWYRDEVVPAINFFRENPSYKVHDIEGEQTIEAVHQDIKRALNLPL